MKLILFCISICFLTSSFAQESNAVIIPIEHSKFSIGWTYTPEVSYRIISEGTNTDNFTTQFIEYKNEHERAKFGQSANIFVGYKLSSLFTLEGGVGFTNFGMATQLKHVLYFPTENDPGVDYYSYRLYNHYAFSIPINLRMNFGKKRLKGFCSIGLAPSYLGESRSTEHREYANGDKTVKTNVINDAGDYTKFILGAQLSVGIDYQITNKLDLRIAPIFRMTTNSMLTDTEIRGNYFNAGISFGTVFNF